MLVEPERRGTTTKEKMERRGRGRLERAMTFRSKWSFGMVWNEGEMENGDFQFQFGFDLV
ncbi:unnamed protein product [Citrullus colocynthis]|uniref:Uncharacterized protein n=1 Tax=Citrullus colocynthis TaxID=252529 RepID=A0ABP0XRD3_9ROSI